MPSSDQPGDDRPTLFFLHFLGGSALTWAPVIAGLPLARCVPIDLPGFGDAAHRTGYSVADMADCVAASVRQAGPGRWWLVGHSMGAKVATVLARRAEDGADGLNGLNGLVLVGASPPSPEPMDEARRRTMLGWFAADQATSETEAGEFIRQASGKSLPDAVHAAAAVQVLRASRPAWQAWLEGGSLEDWSGKIGVLDTPTLLVTGADDADLGPDAQTKLMVRHFSQARLVTIPGAGHLLPLEVPDKIARVIDGFVGATSATPTPSPAYRALIDSDRVSHRTRELLLARLQPDAPAYRPRAIAAEQLATLRALLGRVLPQTGPAIDLAARIDAQLQAGAGDGWRFAELPPDAEAYRAGLQTLDAASGQPFAVLTSPEQDALLETVCAGKLAAKGLGLLDPKQMKLWFEDVCSDAVRTYVAHPATLSRMGYSGIGYGGDGEPKGGFHLVGPGERESWEPEADPAP